MQSRDQRIPSTVVELLRLFVVAFAAGLGYQAALLADPDGSAQLGGLGTAQLGVVLGSGFGYVVGGMLGRSTVAAVSRTDAVLRDVPGEHIVAGVLGALLGAVTGAAVSWPVLLLGRLSLGLPIFGFLTVTLALLGYRTGVGKREAVLGVFGPRVGLAARGRPDAVVPRVLDTSVAIDGRILAVVRAGFVHGRMLVPTPVLAELQGLADAGDDLRRSRGRRGLELLEALRQEKGVDLEVIEDEAPAVHEVDAKLVRTCLDRDAALLTLDTNLAKAAALAGVRVLNLHALALALRPPVVAGDDVSVLLLKAGKEPGQAVGYLDDGTMVVAEASRSAIGTERTVTVTSVLTTANGRMVFARPLGSPATPAPVSTAPTVHSPRPARR